MSEVHCLPALADNFIFCFELPSGKPDSRDFFVVDPGDAKPVLDWLTKVCPKDEFLSLTILLTHKHPDHVDGVAELAAWWQGRWPKCALNIYLSSATAEHLPLAAKTLPAKKISSAQDGSIIDNRFKVFATPGHTLDHISFYCPEIKALFSGDVVFGLGCGRLFEGTPQMMMQTLARISELPSETRIFCAHEYTEKNFQFSKPRWSAPEVALIRRELDQRWKDWGRTVPSTLGFEKAHNLFLCETDLVRWTALRLERNHF